jgi:hypothetical protein
MRRNAATVLMVAAMSGCVSFQGGPETGGGPSAPHWGKSYGPHTVPGVKGPYGESVAMAAPYDSAPPGNAYMARQMMSQSLPLGAVQMNGPGGGMPGMMPGAMPPGGMMSQTSMPRGPMLSPPGVPFAPGVPAGPNMPPGGPGMMPGGMMPTGGMPGNMPMGGGVINANIPPGMMPPGAVMQVQQQMMQANAAAGMRFQGQRTQVRFVRPSGMEIAWFTQGSDGKPMYSTNPVKAPGRYNFPQAAIYRLKLSNIDALPGVDVYPTMEVVPCNPKTEAFLAHSAVPIEFTNYDWKQIKEGNYLVKVIYLPDPQFQDVAGTGTDEIISTTLEPGADPIQEALRRGSILVVLRMGNVDQEAPNTPPLNAGPPMVGQAGPGMMPTPGQQQPNPGMKAPPLPPPMAAAPRPIAKALSVSAPKGPAPIAAGVSSTAKFQDLPPPAPVPAAPASEANSASPAFPGAAPPVPQNNAPVLQQAPRSEDGPGISSVQPPPPPPPPLP